MNLIEWSNRVKRSVLGTRLELVHGSWNLKRRHWNWQILQLLFFVMKWTTNTWEMFETRYGYPVVQSYKVQWLYFGDLLDFNILTVIENLPEYRNRHFAVLQMNWLIRMEITGYISSDMTGGGHCIVSVRCLLCSRIMQNQFCVFSHEILYIIPG